MYQTRYRDTEGLSQAVEEPGAEARPKLRGLRLYDCSNEVYHDIPLDKTLTIGRDAQNDIVVPTDFVSRFHCRIENGCYLFDGNSNPSTNGTYVNGDRVNRRKILRPDDEITLAGPDPLCSRLFIVCRQEESE